MCGLCRLAFRAAGYYNSQPYQPYQPMGRRRTLSIVDRLAEMFDDGSDGFVKPGEKSVMDDMVVDPRRALLQEDPYPGRCCSLCTA